MQPLAFADEQGDAELLLELLDSGGHVGLHAIKFLRSPRNAAGVDDGTEDMQIGQFHRSHSEIEIFRIIHFA